MIGAALIAQIVGGCLFLSMYTVFRAKETLPEKKMRERIRRETWKNNPGTEENQ